MDSQDQRGAVRAVVDTLRKATRIAQLAPFVYLGVYVISIIVCLFASERVVCAIDTMLMLSPAATGGMLIASKLFKLCRWHKIATLLPMSSQVEGFFDAYIITFTQNEIILLNMLISVLSLMFIIVAVRHFSYGC